MKLVIRGLLGFEWDGGNCLLNDPVCQVDLRHSDDEQRHVALGTTIEGRRLFVSFTVRQSRVRVISARPMSRRERAVHGEIQSASRE